ncbi:hypothetical protein HJC99_05505 [Candidatus Saccharibacteria bacterium]|nr:hypothetical protein [Candidatus Saccharibacteria bacterium]
MKRTTHKRATAGLIILCVYLGLVITFELVRALTSIPIVEWLASSPAGLARGEWWRLVTSAFVVEGPVAPQIAITAILGGLIIWFRGSWMFWGIATAGHIFGTLFTYVAVIGAGTLTLHQLHHFLGAPDYGISLIWSSALGALAGAAWLGPDGSVKSVYRPWLSFGAFSLMIIVVILSSGDDAIQHAVAFVIGALLIAAFDRRGEIRRHPTLKQAA